MASCRRSRGGKANGNRLDRHHFCVEGSQVDSVWDAKTQEKAIEVEGPTYVGAVDISPDSTRFATGTGMHDKKASIWDILTGERLIGPLPHDGSVKGVKFSLNGEHIATVCPATNSIHVFSSHNGDQLIKINNGVSDDWSPITPLAWSSNGQQIFVASSSNKIKSFDVSTGSQLVESQVHDSEDRDAVSIALASNEKFLVTFARHSTGITFWDTSTLTQIGPVIEDSQDIRSIALSPDCSYLATGGFNGNITIRNLSNVLPDSYGPFLVSICAFTTLAGQIRYALSSLIDTSFRHVLKKNPNQRHLKIGHSKRTISPRPRVSRTTNHRTRLRWGFVILQPQALHRLLHS